MVTPNDKILSQSKFKAFANNKINVTEKMKFVLGGTENILGKGDNTGFHAFSPFPTMFSNSFFFKLILW